VSGRTTVETEPRSEPAPARASADAAAPRPFLATPVSDPPPARRLLVLTYHFPPSGLVGGLRWQKMTRYAVERGWGVDVFCLHPDDLPVRDDDRLADLPGDVRVYGVREREPAPRRVARTVARLRRRLLGRPVAPVTHVEGAPPGVEVTVGEPRPESLSRAEVFAGRPSVRRSFGAALWIASSRAWPHDAARLADAVVEPRHRAVITSGPPHLVHDTGRSLARARGLAHVIDMRDPWSLTERTPEPVASRTYYALSSWLERRAVLDAALVTCNTEHAARAMRRVYPAVAQRIIAVMNGADEEEIPVVARGRRFVVAYAGQVYMDRTPRALFRAAARLVRDFAIAPRDFGIEFMGGAGTIDGRTIQDLASDEGLGGYFVMHPGRPRAEALRFLAAASLLVSLPQDSQMAIPSKVFEYSQYDAWLLALANPDSATALLLEGSGADVVAPNDEDGIFAVLRHHYQEHTAGIRPAPVNADGRLSRRGQAAILLDRLDALR
jgi:hypothetical protein